MLKRLTAILSIVCSATLAAVICLSITACEDEPSGTSSFFATNGAAAADSYPAGSTPISILPSSATASTVGQQIAFRAIGGSGPYNWSVGNTAAGTINATTDDDAVYTVVAIAPNSVLVSDRYNNTASLTVGASGGPALDLHPSSANVGVGTTINFWASGGTPPYTFTVAVPGWGTISANGSYVATAPGTNVVYVTDNDGTVDGASVSQY